ncbi:GDP-mannose 4,6-dehydratase [Calditrichota bacterium]
MCKILVTGAGGFIGSHLVDVLASNGHKIRALVRYNSTNDIRNLKNISANTLSKIEIVFGDITDSRFADHIVKGCDIVMHLAALIGIPYSYIAPISYTNVNIIGTLNILEACRLHKTERMFHTSTSEVYGTALYEPIDEAHPLQAQSPYSASKIAADKLVQSYYLSFELPIITIRPFNTYGPRQSTRAVIPTIINQLLAHPEYLEIGSLEPKRDFTFVTDTAKGYLTALNTGGLDGETINLGTGYTISIGDIVETISGILNAKPEIRTVSSRIRPENSEVMLLISNNEKAKRLMSWMPKFNLEEGLINTVEYFRNNPIDPGINTYTV